MVRKEIIYVTKEDIQMPGLIGRKIGMTSVFSADGKNIPCTVIEVGPCVVTHDVLVNNAGLVIGVEPRYP